MKKRFVTTLVILAAMVSQILPGKQANAASYRYDGYQIRFVKPSGSTIYLEGNFSSGTLERFNADFRVYINNGLYDRVQKSCSGKHNYNLNSRTLSFYDSFSANGYATK